MRPVAGLLMGVLLVGVASLPAEGLGGLVLVGAGTGTSYESIGYVCRDAPFSVQAVYLPGNRGMLAFNWVKPTMPGENCFFPVNWGGSLGLGTVSIRPESLPPASFQGACVGNEAQGLQCGDGVSFPVYVRIGPYAGPGSSVWLRKATPIEVFEGVFVAV